MKRFIPFALCVLIIALFITGCDSRSEANTSKVLSDLRQLDYSSYAFVSPFVNQSDYSYTSENLIKRQTNPEDKEDIVFYDVQMNNEYFQMNLSVKLVYNYYDDGGWILDEHFIERTKVVPTDYPEVDLIVEYLGHEGIAFNYIDNTKSNYIQNNNLIHFCESKNTIKWKNLDKAKGVAAFNINATIDNFATFRGSMDLYFNENNGWSFSGNETNSLFKIENKVFNYDTRCTGKYSCHKIYRNDFVFDKTYHIKSVDAITETIEISDEHGDGQIEFDPLTINGFMTHSDEKPYMYYSTKDDTWNWGDQKYKKVS